MALSKAAGAWTYEDLLALPDDGKRYEIIAGELYEMPAPSWDHQVTIVNLVLLLAPIVQRLGGRLVIAPLDVFFPGADPVQPDIVVLLPEGRAVPFAGGVQGPPDILIEVVSPSNWGHDRLTKRALYAAAGVREYWLVDPVQRTVELLALERDAFHGVRTATGDEAVISPVLAGAGFPLSAIFAGIMGDEVTR
jgi:Uma2 family endonuclease